MMKVFITEDKVNIKESSIKFWKLQFAFHFK